MDWLFITLLCAFTLASSDAAAKRWLGHTSVRELTLVRLGLSGLLVAPLAIAQPWPDPPLEFWGWLGIAVPLEIVAMLLYMKAIRDNPLSLTLPYMAFTPVFVILTAWLILDEKIPLQGFAGILLVVAGSWLLNFEGDWRAVIAPFKTILRNSGSRMMLATALIYAVTATVGKAAMQWMPPSQFGAFYFTVVGLATIVVISFSAPKSIGIIKRHPWASFAVAGLMGVMVVTHFLALSLVETAYMITVKRTSLLFGILYGVWLFKEHHAVQHLLAGCLMVAGVGMILIV